MVVLKRIKASTLIETMVATVLIVLIFMMASLLLNSIFSNSIQANHQQPITQLQKLEYHYKNGNITTPYVQELDQWNIELVTEEKGTSIFLRLEATHKKTNTQIKTYSTLAE